MVRCTRLTCSICDVGDIVEGHISIYGVKIFRAQGDTLLMHVREYKYIMKDFVPLSTRIYWLDSHQTGHGHLVGACAHLRCPPDPLWLRSPSASTLRPPFASLSTSDRCSVEHQHLLRSVQRFSGAARLRRRAGVTGGVGRSPGDGRGLGDRVSGASIQMGGQRSGSARRLCVTASQVSLTPP